MNIPFTTEQFLNVFKTYNESVFPFQFIMHASALFIFYILLKHKKNINRIVFFITGFYWVWAGLIYHILFFSQINKAALSFGFIFIIEGLLLLFVAFKGIELNFKRTGANILSVILMTYALIIYPLIGFFSEHSYPYSPTFGLPCPTTIFTIGLILIADKKRIILFIIPLLWSVLGFTAVMQFGIYEDVGLLISSFLFVIYMFLKRKYSLSVKVSG